MKWELVLAMVALIGLGLWLAGGQNIVYPYENRRPGAEVTEQVRVANSRGVVEVLREPATGQNSLRILFRDGHVSPVMGEAEFRATFGDTVLRAATAARPNWVFRFFNITSWTNFLWITVGFLGQLAFSGRWIVQWFVSEKERKSVVPGAYWWMSLVGGVVLFAYFGWRQDFIGILGQAPGVVIYGRNIRLTFKHKRREERAAAEARMRGAAGNPGSGGASAATGP